MNSSIKDTIDIKSIKTYKEVGYDEDRTMIAFEPAIYWFIIRLLQPPARLTYWRIMI